MEHTSRVKMCEDIGNSDRNNIIPQNCKSFVCPLSSENRVLVGCRLIMVCRKLCCSGGKEEANGL